MFEHFMDFVKAVFDKAPINVIMFACSVTAFIAFGRSGSDALLYIGIFSCAFLVANLLRMLLPKWREAIKKKKEAKEEKFIKKQLLTDDFQEKAISQLDKYERSILLEIYDAYPEPVEYDSNMTPIIHLEEMCMIRGGTYLSLLGTNEMRKYSLQPWIKNAIEKGLLQEKDDSDEDESSEGEDDY